MNYIICNNSIYKYIEDYIRPILHIINAELVTQFDYNNFIYEDSNNYIFVQDIPSNLLCIFNKKQNIYLLNIEQLSCESKFNRHLLPYYNYQHINIIDYSYANLTYYNNFKNNKYILPYKINYNEIYNTNKQKDICLIADIVPINRQIIIDALKAKNIIVDIISGYGKKRDEELFKYKILLNISFQKDFNIFESIRCDRCVYNKMIVISDKKKNNEKHHLKDYVIFEEYENIPDKVVDVINNYDYYYDKLFKNFNIEQISGKINDISKELVEKLSHNLRA